MTRTTSASSSNNSNTCSPPTGTTMLTLRVTGLGHTLTLEHPSTSSIESLQQEIERQTQIPVVYQRLLARGHKLDASPQTRSLNDAGIQDRTKIMLLHNALYAQEKQGFEALEALAKEIGDLEDKKKQEISMAEISEFATRICCKLDLVDTQGSDNLRARRKELIRRAEILDQV